MRRKATVRLTLWRVIVPVVEFGVVLVALLDTGFFGSTLLWLVFRGPGATKAWMSSGDRAQGLSPYWIAAGALIVSSVLFWHFKHVARHRRERAKLMRLAVTAVSESLRRAGVTPDRAEQESKDTANEIKALMKAP